MQRNPSNWESLENWYPFFPQHMLTFLQSDSHLMVYFTKWERYGFFHQFLIARKMQQNPPCELPGCFSTTLLFLIVPKFGESFKEQTEKTDKVNFFFKERKFDSTYAKFKAKYIKRRIGCGCNFIKKDEYKYILCKSMPPYTNLSLFLIISPKNYISYSKILMKRAATVVFGRKVSQGFSFKNSCQLKLFYFHLMLWLWEFTNFSLSFVDTVILNLLILWYLTVIILKDITKLLLFYTKRNFPFLRNM